MTVQNAPEHLIDSRYAFWRLIKSLVIMVMGSSCMFIVSVVLPEVQAEFGVSRSEASLPSTLLWIGFGAGGLLMGRVADRWGVWTCLLIGAVGLSIGFIWAAHTTDLLVFALVHGIFLGFFGTSAMFAPLVADTSLWWNKRRGIAVAVCASGNYLAGAIWPPLTQLGVSTIGWRDTYIWMGLLSGISVALLALLMRRRPPLAQVSALANNLVAGVARPFGLNINHAQFLMCVAGLACCVAMSMPQVHIVAYCADLGYGPARGAEMLALMLGCGIISRLISGVICDRIGGIRTLLLGSALQGIALFMFLPFDGLVSLYLISALFGLFQGGIVPSYAIIIREYFPAAEAGRRVGSVIMCTMFGMALGGWMSGKIFDLTGSYQMAMVNGMVWNLLNLAIAGFLFWRVRQAVRN
jgi:MFS family permease